MTEAREFLPTVATEVSDVKVLWGCIVYQYQTRKGKDGTEKRYGPYASHVTKIPPDHEKQCWDYIGKVGAAKYNAAIAHLKENPLLLNTRNPISLEQLEKSLKRRVGKKSRRDE